MCNVLKIKANGTAI